MYSLHDLDITRASAQIAAHSLPDLFPRRIRTSLKETIGDKQHAGRTETALHSPGANKGLLQRMEPVAFGKKLHGLYVVTIYF